MRNGIKILAGLILTVGVGCSAEKKPTGTSDVSPARVSFGSMQEYGDAIAANAQTLKRRNESLDEEIDQLKAEVEERQRRVEELEEKQKDLISEFKSDVRKQNEIIKAEFELARQRHELELETLKKTLEAKNTEITQALKSAEERRAEESQALALAHAQNARLIDCIGTMFRTYDSRMGQMAQLIATLDQALSPERTEATKPGA